MEDSNMPGMLEHKKPCSKCGKSKSANEFHRDKRHKDGLYSICKKCKKETDHKRRSANPEKHRRQNRKWYVANREKALRLTHRWKLANPEKNREQVRRWNIKNPDKKHHMSHEWYANNPERAYENNRKWRAVNFDKVYIYRLNYRARKNGNNDQITVAEWRALLEKYGFKCLCCGRTDVKITLDHIVPFKLGGTNTIKNAQILCVSCNTKKGTKIIDYR